MDKFFELIFLLTWISWLSAFLFLFPSSDLQTLLIRLLANSAHFRGLFWAPPIRVGEQEEDELSEDEDDEEAEEEEEEVALLVSSSSPLEPLSRPKWPPSCCSSPARPATAPLVPPFFSSSSPWPIFILGIGECYHILNQRLNCPFCSRDTYQTKFGPFEVIKFLIVRDKRVKIFIISPAIPVHQDFRHHISTKIKNISKNLILLVISFSLGLTWTLFTY